MQDMEHMAMKWEVCKTDYSFSIGTVEHEPWYLCEMVRRLPGDFTGEKTAQLICDQHNAALDRPQSTIAAAEKQAEMLAVAERFKAFVAWRNDLTGEFPFPAMGQLDRDLGAAVKYITERQGK